MQLGHITTYHAASRQFRQVPVVNDRRLSHTWVIGRTGVGKSTALVRWALDDVVAGQGLAFFDPHGDAAEAILSRIPRRRRDDVVYFNPAELAIGFNIFDTVPEESRAFVAAGLVDTFKAVWGYADLATPALDQFLYNGARALMDYPGGTLFELKFLLTSATFRRRVIAHVRDPVIADFWLTDFETHMPEREQRERTLSTLNKIGAVIADPYLRTCIAQKRSRIDFRQLMDHGGILVASLPQGRLGLEKSAMIGSLLIGQLQLAGLSRPPTARRPFHVFVDECHRFAPATLAEMLSGIRKFGISLTLANQYMAQLPAKLRQALIGTVGTIAAFRLGVLDAELLEPEFQLTNDDPSLCELAPFEAYVRRELRTFRLAMPAVAAPVLKNAARKIRNANAAQRALDRAVIEKRLARFVAGT